MHLPAGELSRKLLFELSPSLITVRGAALAAVGFAFFYSKHPRKVALLKNGRYSPKTRLQLMVSDSSKWLRLLGLIEEDVKSFNSAVAELFTCLWAPEGKPRPANKPLKSFECKERFPGSCI